MNVCEYTIWYQGAERRCGRVTGTRVWYDDAGTLHAACGSHVAERLHRFPEADPPEPEWLDAMTLAKAEDAKTWTDAGYTEAELRYSFGDR